ncbi:MAG: hypothetical protein KDA24_18105, partial [Deltaproteobacteria bacterium]|nr:hypothetical protein [Deltaproteobacteria bacterium]
PEGATVASGTESKLQAESLLRVLEEGTGMQRAAAAKALSLSFAGNPSRPVVHGLLSLLSDPDADEDSRVEAWVAACRVMGDPLPWELESTLRRDGPDAIDPAQVMAWQDRLERED